MSDAMVVSGIVCLIAAVVGGALKWPGGVEIRELPSLRRQALLGALGAVLLVGGIVLGLTNELRSVPSGGQALSTASAPHVTPFVPSSIPSIPVIVAPTDMPSSSLPPVVEVGVGVDEWRRSSESVCMSAIAASGQASDPLAWAEVFVAAAAALRAVESPASIATQVDEWHRRVGDVVELWRQVAGARVLGDMQTNAVLTQESATAARLANRAAEQLGLSQVCFLAENI